MIDQLRQELKASPLLRIGGAGILAILVLNGLLSLEAEQTALIKEQQQLSTKIGRIRQYARQPEWLDRARQAKATEVELESRLWRNRSPGIAQAEFQDWLTHSLTKRNMANLRIDMVTDSKALSGEAPDEWAVKAKVNFDFVPATFNDWLSQLASYERQVIIERLTIRGDASPKVEVLLTAPFRKIP